MENRFTEGTAFDGAAILDHGKPITITEILNNLNQLHEIRENIFDGQYFCGKCNKYIDSKFVDENDTHSERAGGCGGHVV